MWNWLNGKKTVISAIAWPLFELITSQGWVTGTASNLLVCALTALTGTGLLHKLIKE